MKRGKEKKERRENDSNGEVRLGKEIEGME